MGAHMLSSMNSVASESGWSAADSLSPGIPHITGYHFVSSVTSSLAYNENVDFVYGYKVSTKEAVIAKVSSSSDYLEREFHTTKNLYQLPEGSTFIVQPLEYINLVSGLSAAIYANEKYRHVSIETPTITSPSSSVVSSVTVRPWMFDCDLTLKSMPTRDSLPIYDLATFLRFAIKCTESLEFIHKFNMVHGELQLSAFQWSGHDADPVKLWNFGCGFKSLGTYLTTDGWRKAAQSKELTQMLQNLMVYVSPERTGRTAYTLDHRSDIYSLGIAFFIFLTKRNPFEGGPLEILNGVLGRSIPLVHELQLDVPEIVSRIIEKMTSKAPDDRYSSAYGARKDLQECLNNLLEVEDSEVETCIPVFPLARHDIASVFTLPKTIYGRQSAISEMTNMVEQFATNIKASRMWTCHGDRSSTIITSTSSNISGRLSSTASVSDTVSESSATEEVNWGDLGGSKSVKTRSRNSGFGGSESSGVRSNMLSSPNSTKRNMTTIVSLYGPPGIGKSTILSVVNSIARQRGYTAMVKFDSRKKVPYGGALQTLSQILQQILSGSEDDIKRFYEHLKTNIGAQFCNINLFFDSVPELLTLMNVSNSKDDRKPIGQIHMENIESRKKFQALFVGIFKAFSHWQMITLFLDDLHRADDNSLELLESLVASKIKLLAFISYREHEVTPKLTKILDNPASNIHFVKAEAFDINSTIDFICDTLHRSKDVSYDAVMPLASLLMQRTSGNPFYIAHLMQTLERKKLVFFNWETKQWDFNLEAIQESTAIGVPAENSELDLWFMVGRLQELSSDTQMLLKWASFVGDTFSWKMLKELILDSTVPDDAGASTSTHRATSKTSIEPQASVTSHPKKTQSAWSSLCHRDPSDSLHSRGSGVDPSNGLKIALQEGYFVPIGPDELKWSHDRVAQAAGELASSDTRSRIHLAIARYMMRSNRYDAILIADHIMQCYDLVKLASDKVAFRRVLIESGSREQSSGAHDMAFANYEAAIELGDSESEWNTTNYTETLNLYTNAAALSWISGGYERTEQLLEAIFQRARNPIDRLNAYRVQSKYYFGRRMPEKGQESLVRCLESLDQERYRLKSTAEEMQAEANEMEQQIRSIEIEAVMSKKPCVNPLVIGIMTVLEELCTFAYWNSQVFEMHYYGMRIIKMTLEEGMSDVSPVGFMFTALRFALVYKNYDFAETLGTIGFNMLENIGNNYIRGRIYFQYAILVLRWKHHYRDAIKYFETGVCFSVSAGDRMYVTLHRAYGLLIHFGLNERITDTLHEGEAYYDDIYTWSASDETNLLVMSIIRACKALQGRTYYHTEEVFDGDDGFNSVDFLEQSCHQSTDPTLPMSWYNTFKLIVQTLYGHTDAAIANGFNNLEATYHHACHRHTRVMLHYFSLALMNKLWDGVPDSERRHQYISQIRSNQEAILEWKTHPCVNNLMFWTFLEAEMAAYEDSSNITKTALLYEDAINQARQGGWFFHTCVAQEYAGAFYFRVGMSNVAFACIKKAIDLYAMNGSYGKAKQLRIKYSNLINSFGDMTAHHEIGVQTDLYPLLTSQARWTSNVSLGNYSQNTCDDKSRDTESNEPLTAEQKLMTLDILDMSSILKSSFVMSSEVKLEGLLTSMMSIILENSGAESGAIIVKDETFGVCAYGNVREEARILDPPLPLSDDNDLVPTAIIYHTISTGEYTFVPSVEQDSRFATGAWFVRAGERVSVICMPIKHKDSLIGCLIIEGPVGVFTQRHITLLSLLCQQMGISITNAFLFKSVQRVTMAYTRMIEMQKQALDEARASKEAADRATQLREIFLANMSHEIRTPFSGFYGMISLLSETNLDGEQRDLVKTAKESCEMLLQIIDDLLNFSKLQAGKVTLDLTPVVVEELIADVIEILIAMAIKKQINVSYSISADVPSVVMADANRLRQIIINLLGNAIKFTSEGEISIRCSVEKAKSDEHEAPKNHVTLLFEVIDCGIGISEEQHKFLFAPFSQVDGSTTRKYGGTGLGLSICLQLVELMSGHIDVDSTPGKGSTFHFTINAVPATEKIVHRDSLTASLLKELQGSRILVIAKYASTIATIQDFLPTIQVDGATSISELAFRQANDYTAIVIGLYLVKDQQFTEWSAHLETFMQKTRCVIVMHYPACGAFMRKDGKGESVVPITSPNIPVPRDPLRQQALVRITFPVRRHTLLQNLVDAVHEDSSPQPAIPRPRAQARYDSSEKICSTTVSSKEYELFSTMHVLIAEDNPVAQKLLVKQLTRLGFQVDCANNGHEAVETWANHPIGYYKVGFFDHHMPKCDGIEATKLIREAEINEQRSIRFPIIALTADVQDSARKACLNAGMDEYVTKPMNQKILVEALRRHCKSITL